jgi:tetratricopeptide (TPR) repeat protein
MVSEKSPTAPEVAAAKPHFFVSRAGADAAWAEWIAWQLEAEGLTVMIQDWDFGPGINFVHAMQRASTDAERTIAVLSPRYFDSPFTEAEWTVAFSKDPTGEQGLLLPIRIEDFPLPGMFGPRTYLDLFDLDKDRARTRLLKWIDRAGKRRVKRDREPPYPREAGPNYPGEMPSLYGVPARNRNFAGREAPLRELRNHLTSGKKADTIGATRQVAVHGLGGTGKSHLVVEYVWRWASDYSCVVWLRAESPASLGADFDSLADRLSLLKGNRGAEQSKVIAAVREYLEEHPGWLAIFDNAPEPRTIESAVPRTGGHVIFTSQYAAWGKSAIPLQVQVWRPEEGLAFLQQRMGLREGEDDAPDRSAAAELIRELGGLPLALEHAAAYCEQSRLSMSDYLSLFRDKRLNVFRPETLEIEPGGDDVLTVTTTWNLSLNRIRNEERYPEVAALFNLFAFFGSDRIPLEAIRAGANCLPQPVSEAVRDDLRLNHALAVLLAYSLINVEGRGKDRAASVHRLVQEVARDRLTSVEQAVCASVALQVVLETFPGNSYNPSTWRICGQLAPHAEEVLRHAERLQIELEQVAELLTRLGAYALGRAEYAKAEANNLRALEIREKALGPDHVETAQSLNNVALVYRNQGRYKESEPLHQRALRIREESLSPDHPGIAESLNNLALVYRYQGRYPEAEPLCLRALAIWDKAPGSNDSNTAASLNNLAELYRNQGRYAEAEPLYVRALSICEGVRGPDHPDTALALNNLAELYRNEGRYTEAEPLYLRALAIREKTLGPDHPITATTLNNLAAFYRNQGEYAKAEPLYLRALAIREKALGPDHDVTAQSLNSVALLYRSQGRSGEAEPLYRRALKICENALGPNHRNTATTLNNLAELYRDHGRYAEAEPLYQRALAIRESALPHHPETAQSLEGLAELYCSVDRHAEAEPLYQRALAIREKALPDHPDTAKTRANYAAFLNTIGRA